MPDRLEELGLLIERAERFIAREDRRTDEARHLVSHLIVLARREHYRTFMRTALSDLSEVRRVHEATHAVPHHSVAS